MKGRDRRSDRGTAAIEFAILLPVLMLILMGTLEWGRYFTFRESVIHAAREGARGGTLLDATATDARAAATAYLSTLHITPTSIDVDMNHSIAGGSGAMPAIQVQLVVPFTTVTGLPLAVPTSIQVAAVMPKP